MPDDPRAARRQARLQQVLGAAWDVAREYGLAALSLHEVARRVGLRQPSLYAYVDSKAGLYDAMFAQTAAGLCAHVTAPPLPEDPREALALATRRIADYATADVVRFQLLFLRTVPGFEPTPASFERSVELAQWLDERLREAGATGPDDLDLYTGLVVGLLTQQTSNDPGGDRWTRHLDTVLALYFRHIDTRATALPPHVRGDHA